MNETKNTPALRLLPLREQPALLERAVAWFSSKWSVPAEAYRESMTACLAGGDVPQWYLLLDAQGAIAGGAGVIENDFHDRPDLAPNLCALYVEPEHRGRGLAGVLLDGTDRETACQALFDLCIAVAQGQETCGEHHEFGDIAIFKNGVTL